jgi:hypothetical protein
MGEFSLIGRMLMESEIQEALSRAHYAHRVLKLESGRYAVFAFDLCSCEILDDPRDFDLTFNRPEKAQCPKTLNEILSALKNSKTPSTAPPSPS